MCETHKRQQMATQLEYNTVSCQTFSWINMDLIICTSPPWWQHPWTLTYMNWEHYFISVCWDQTEQTKPWENCSRFSCEKCIRKVKNSLHHKLLMFRTQKILLIFNGQMGCMYPTKSHSSWMKEKTVPRGCGMGARTHARARAHTHTHTHTLVVSSYIAI